MIIPKVGLVSKVNNKKIAFNGLERSNDKGKANIGVNGGGGRIGQNILRQYFLAKFFPAKIDSKIDLLKPIYENLNLVSINMGKNNSLEPDDLVTQLKHDSIMGRLPDSIKLDANKDQEGDLFLSVSNQDRTEEIRIFTTYDVPNWKGTGADIVIDATGAKTTTETMGRHISEGGAKYAILSAPAKDEMLTVVPGINDESLNLASINNSNKTVSAASCTTTGIAPYIKLMDEKVGVEGGIIVTAHAATNSQEVLDKFGIKAAAKTRGTLDSMIPTSTGAAKAIGKVYSKLKGKLDGSAVRVPSANGSIAYITLNLKNELKKEELLKILKDASGSHKFKNLIKEAPKGSTSKDVLQDPTSGLYVAENIKVQGKMVQIPVFYDNEYGYTRSLMSLANKVNDKILNFKEKVTAVFALVGKQEQEVKA